MATAPVQWSPGPRRLAQLTLVYALSSLVFLKSNGAWLGFITPRFQYACSARAGCASARGPSITAAAVSFGDESAERQQPAYDEQFSDDYSERSKWRQQYQRVLPFGEARRAARSMGFSNKEAWDEWVADGKLGLGPYMPGRPQEMYAEEWQGWDDFLGVLLDFSSARKVVASLGLKSQQEWYDFVDADPARLVAMRLPFSPRKFYKETWEGYEHWLGLPETTLYAPKDGFGQNRLVDGQKTSEDKMHKRRQWFRKMLPFEEIRRAARSMGFSSKDEWDEWVSDGKKGYGPYMPSRPEEMYAEEWQGWDDFLGVLLDFTSARKVVGSLGLKSQEEWYNFVDADPARLVDLRIPCRPRTYYKTSWEGYDHWLGLPEETLYFPTGRNG